MTCPQHRLIEAYLDGELSREERKEFAKHLDHCTSCRSTLAEHKRLAQWADEVIAESLPDLPGDVTDNIDVSAAWSRFQATLETRAHRTETEPATPFAKSESVLPPQTRAENPVIQTRRWSFMAKTYQKWLIGTAAAAVVLGSLTMPQVQAAASDLLSMFRVEKFETIRVTQQDMQELQQWLSSGATGERSLAGLGEITRHATSSPPQHFESLDLAKNEGYEPAPVPGGFFGKSLDVQPEMTMEFKLNTEKANNLLKSLGSDVRFDDKLNNKPFSVTFPRLTQTNYVSDGGLKLTYMEVKTPHMEVPAGVDINQLRQTVLQLPFIPQNITKQLASIDDWQNTVPLPYVEGTGNTMEKVSVNGSPGIFASDQGNNNAFLLWQKDGELHRLQAQGGSSLPDLKSHLLDWAKTYN